MNLLIKFFRFIMRLRARRAWLMCLFLVALIQAPRLEFQILLTLLSILLSHRYKPIAIKIRILITVNIPLLRVQGNILNFLILSS